jgi:hypothetical protein
VARARVGHALKRSTIEGYSIPELLDDPIAGLLRATASTVRLKRLLPAHALDFGNRGRTPHGD